MFPIPENKINHAHARWLNVIRQTNPRCFVTCYIVISCMRGWQKKNPTQNDLDGESHATLVARRKPKCGYSFESKSIHCWYNTLLLSCSRFSIMSGVRSYTHITHVRFEVLAYVKNKNINSIFRTIPWLTLHSFILNGYRCFDEGFCKYAFNVGVNFISSFVLLAFRHSIEMNEC